MNDLWDDFTSFPERSVPPLIFLIGCGHVEAGEWRFERFLAEELTEEAESRVIDAWLAHMEAVRARVDAERPEPLVIHWSHAETSHFEDAYNSACARHPDQVWRSPRWFDMLRKVFRAEPIVVRGAFGFGLKDVARALHAHGLVEMLWEESSPNGLGAMAGAWWCYEEADRAGVAVEEIDLVSGILGYNEVDSKLLMEIARWLRRDA